MLRLRSMRTYICLCLFLFSQNVSAQLFEGSGFSVIGKDKNLSKLLAIMDAYSDALMKAGGNLDSQVEMKDGLIKSNKFKITQNNSYIQVLKKVCQIQKVSIHCQITLNLSSKNDFKKNQQPVISECNSKEGLQFCFVIQEKVMREADNMIQTNLMGELRVLWRALGKNKVLTAKPFRVTGLALDEEASYQSGMLQLRRLARIEGQELYEIYSAFTSYREINFKAEQISKQQLLYLTYLGGECLCSWNECILFLPKIFE